MIWLVVGATVPSFVLSFLFAFVVRRYAARCGLIDSPGLRKVHHQPTPLGGGLAIWVGVVGTFLLGQIALAICFEADFGTITSEPTTYSIIEGLRQFVAPHVAGLWAQSGKLWTLLAAATVLMLLGLVDDHRGLDWRLRLAAQTIVALWMAIQGWRLSLFIDSDWITGVASVLWIVGLINTFNMLDNMDGLSAGVAAIAGTMLATVILTAPDPITQGPQLFVGGFLLVLSAALAGFLCHNRPPARLFMGDAGSYFVGFCVATATISATFAGEGLPQHAILAPLCVLAIPLYDTITVVWIRLREGRSPFSADRNHISHRLVALGLSQRRAVLAIYAATVACGLGAFLLHRVDTVGALIILAVIGLLLAAAACVELTSRQR